VYAVQYKRFHEEIYYNGIIIDFLESVLSLAGFAVFINFTLTLIIPNKSKAVYLFAIDGHYDG